jgi:hypothetical protein
MQIGPSVQTEQFGMIEQGTQCFSGKALNLIEKYLMKY